MINRRDIQRFIEDNGLILSEERVLIALSGGADSVALLRILLELGYICEAAHCNFHLRGEESNRDEEFVRSLCERLSVSLHVIHFDTRTYAKEHRLSIEMAARELRYDWFEQLRKEHRIRVVAVAHHRDDKVETMLLNLIRGTGINGLTGIPVQNGAIVRPLLSVSREDILEYLRKLQQDFVTDSTNLQDEYMRNKIRLHLLPLMKELNPMVVEKLCDTMDYLSDVSEVYHSYQNDRLKGIIKERTDGEMHITIADLVRQKSAKSLIYELVYPLGFNSVQVDDLFRTLSIPQSGKRFIAPDWEVLRDRERLIIRKRNTLSVEPDLEISVIEITPLFKVSTDRSVAYLDADKIVHPLQIRKWKAGDYFIPLGMKGKKNVCKYMTDQKFSLFQKESQYVMVSGDQIVWLVNERIDQRYRITEDSKRALVVRAIDKK